MTRRIRKKAQLTSIAEPQMVTLTKKPANRSGFKVMRSADGGLEQEVQRADDYLISIELPEGASEEQAHSILSDYGLADEYKVVQTDERYSLVRNDLEGDEKYVPVPLHQGQVAHIAPAAFQRSEDLEIKVSEHKWPDGDAKASIRLTSIRFDVDKFDTAAAVDEWLDSNAIDYPVNGVEQSENAFVVTRSEADDDTREVTLSDGVTGTICRSDTLDFPYALYGRTAEQAYGQWGWGQLDFNAMMADIVFTDKSNDAIWYLQRVLDNVVINSELPLDTRKQLIVNAVSSYAAYQIGLIDALPRAVIEQTRSDEQTTGQENEMSKETETAAKSESVDTKVERSEQEAVTKETTTEEQPKAESEFVTRSELAEVVTAAVAAAMAPAKEETVERSEETPTEEATEESKLDRILGAVGKLAGVVEDQGKTITNLRSEFDEAEGTTTVTRSTDESEGVEDLTEQKTLTRADAGFWAGSFIESAAK